MSVQVCGRKPAGSEDPSKQFKESPKKSDQDDDYRWTTASRRFGTAPLKDDGSVSAWFWHTKRMLNAKTKGKKLFHICFNFPLAIGTLCTDDTADLLWQFGNLSH